MNISLAYKGTLHLTQAASLPYNCHLINERT